MQITKMPFSHHETLVYHKKVKSANNWKIFKKNVNIEITGFFPLLLKSGKIKGQ